MTQLSHMSTNFYHPADDIFADSYDWMSIRAETFELLNSLTP